MGPGRVPLGMVWSGGDVAHEVAMIDSTVAYQLRLALDMAREDMAVQGRLLDTEAILVLAGKYAVFLLGGGGPVGPGAVLGGGIGLGFDRER